MLLQIVIIFVITFAMSDPFCDITAAMNLNSFASFTAWSCNSMGAVVTNPCSPVWNGLSCNGSTVVSINFAAVGLSGISIRLRW